MINPLIREGGKKITGSQEKVELLNSFFGSVNTQKGEKIVHPIKSSTMGDRTGIQVKKGKELLRKHLSASDEFRSPGPDGSHPWVLKMLQI